MQTVTVLVSAIKASELKNVENSGVYVFSSGCNVNYVAVQQKLTDLVVEAFSSTRWLPICSHTPDELASQLHREFGKR